MVARLWLILSIAVKPGGIRTPGGRLERKEGVLDVEPCLLSSR